ncbi:MAG: cytidine deaminase [Clostridia bacterium]|nr:cytidine deaminase [Clostridia bacterium]
MIFYDITEQDKELIKIALETLQRNFDDGIYNHTVGAAIRCKNGKVYSGVNCDGIHGSCAEYVTMGIAISAGEREFDTIVAVHDKAPNCLVAPCGNCRQMLIDYCPDIKVILNDDDSNMIKVGIQELLPFAWKPIIVCQDI